MQTNLTQAQTTTFEAGKCVPMANVSQEAEADREYKKRVKPNRSFISRIGLRAARNIRV